MFRFLGNVGMQFMSAATKVSSSFPSAKIYPQLENVSSFLNPQTVLNDQIRTVTKFSMGKGKRKTVRVVLAKFFRLHWGGWIRTKAGRHKRLWSKTIANRRALKEHVLCNAKQSLLLDRMVSNYWRRPKYYLNDPYTPYHTREEFFITRKKPWRPEGWE